jgi:hypothetical protein
MLAPIQNRVADLSHLRDPREFQIRRFYNPNRSLPEIPSRDFMNQASFVRETKLHREAGLCSPALTLRARLTIMKLNGPVKTRPEGRHGQEQSERVHQNSAS